MAFIEGDVYATIGDNVYVEVISFKKTLDDATMRNKIIFHKPGLN